MMKATPEYFAANNQLKVTMDTFAADMKSKFGLSDAAALMLVGILSDPTIASGLGAGLGGKEKAATENERRALSGPVFKTTKEATLVAESLGFQRVSETVNGQAVYQQGKRFITRDVDGHNGGAWKMADSIKNLGSKETRMGTYSIDLIRIGD
jgi:hypothetical protein